VKKTLTFLAAVALSAASGMLRCDDDVAAAKLLKANRPALEALAANPDVVADVRARNAKPLSPEEAGAIQRRWTAADQSDASYATPYLDNRSAAAFKAAMAKCKGLTKVFSLDQAGNIAASVPKAKDFLHGSEGKFSKAFASGKLEANAATADKSTKKWSVQFSLPIRDAGRTIGVLVATFPLE